MTHRVLAVAVAIVVVASPPRGIAAKGGGHSGGGHSSGGHSGGGHAGGSHSGGGHASSGRSASGRAGTSHASSGQARAGSGGARTGGGQSTAAPSRAASGGGGRATTASGTTEGRPGSRSPNGHLVVGTAVPRSTSVPAVVPWAPTVYSAPVFRPHFVGLGFGYGVRRPAYGYGAAYYALGYDHPLLCEEMIDCYAAPPAAAVDVPQPYDAPPAVPEGAVATIVLQVQPSSAQIFVDGDYVGTVDDVRSELTVAAGVHRVEFRAPGYDPIVVDVRVDAGRRITYRAALKPPA
jgi:PEGA domain